MAIFHIFNPEHDLALAFGRGNFTPPSAGRGMRRCLGFLPAFWAADGDVVVVDDVQETVDAASEFKKFLPDVEYVGIKSLRTVVGKRGREICQLMPWGWNMALRTQMVRAGVPEHLIPSCEELDSIRMLSHRRTSIPLLEYLAEMVPGVVGERVELCEYGMVDKWLQNHNGVGVLKAPWSGSGRGVKFSLNGLDSSFEGFVANTLQRQGSIIAEPYYDRHADFAMEFMSDGKGNADYVGLSVFYTQHGAYGGNCLATEEMKWQMIALMVSDEDLKCVKAVLMRKLGSLCRGAYRGPLGVDMMVVRHQGQLLLHPCVEVNFRRTMGHVAISVAKRMHLHDKVMCVKYCNKQYKLVIEPMK